MLNVSEIIQTIKQLIEVRVQLVLDSIQEKFAAILTKVILIASIAFFGFLVLLFGSLSLAFYLSELTYSTFLGFLYVALIYLLILIVLIIINNSKNIKSKMEDSFKSSMFNNKK